MSGKYRTIVADPPWAYPGGFLGHNGRPGKRGAQVRRRLPYSALGLAELGDLPIADAADDAGANVFTWTTNHYLPSALALLAAWGAEYRHIIVWHKTGANPLAGGLAVTSCEFLLFATLKGGAGLTAKWPDSLVVTKRPGPGQHSRKPDVFLDLIEEASPGPYLELFARRARFGWDYYGDESLGTAEMPERVA